MLTRLVSGVALVALVLVGLGAPAEAALDGEVPISDFFTGQPFPGTFSMLDRSEEGLATEVWAGDGGDHDYTLWYVIFKAPGQCSDGMCGEDDIFNDPANHSAGFNFAQINLTQVSVVHATRAVSDAFKRITLAGGVDIGGERGYCVDWRVVVRRGTVHRATLHAGAVGLHQDVGAK